LCRRLSFERLRRQSGLNFVFRLTQLLVDDRRRYDDL
jgi:hypothetical protein